ncbi:ROK family glucokinase [Ornithinibacillus contaminans]|uniref:ROK family glucokinase n=1 Tax=Ornithinibacillus contaminans TaxID=694055 RepID=UPI00064D95CB|nr:ROK family glucokinase [Ornithinibacillus contaminans]
MNKTVIVGVDIGGTTVKIGFLQNSGDIIEKWEIPTNTANSGLSIVDDIWDAISQKAMALSISQAHILGIGVGAPGFIDSKTGYVYEAVNIGWKDVELAEQLSSKSGLPVFVENDANIAVLGENWLGAGKNSEDVIAITLGTGVGGGIIAGGKILNGVNGTAGEIGHITVDPNGYSCNCGRKGCLETLASATGFVRQAMNIIDTNTSSKLAERYRKNGTVTAKDIFELAQQGDMDSRGIITHTAEVIGLAISNLTMTLNPSKVLVGGGVSKAGDQLLEPIKQAFKKYALPRTFEACEVRIAELGNDAGIIGAASLVKNHTAKM